MSRKSTTSAEPELFETGRSLTLPDDLPPAQLSENARIILGRRYLKKDESGRPVEEPEEMFWRVARVIAEQDLRYGASEKAVDALAREFYRLMTHRFRVLRAPGGGHSFERA